MKRVFSIGLIVSGAFLIGAGATPVERSQEAFVTQHEMGLEIKRVDDLFAAYVVSATAANDVDTKRVDSKLASESTRIDALLTAAKADVTLANARAELTASALAERVDTSAKALAAQVEVTAKAAAAATEASSKAFSERITPLEQMRYEQSGKSIISTPLQMSIVAFCTLLLAYIFQRLMTQVKKE